MRSAALLFVISASIALAAPADPALPTFTATKTTIAGCNQCTGKICPYYCIVTTFSCGNCVGSYCPQYCTGPTPTTTPIYPVRLSILSLLPRC
jgi:hypothetical protein